MDELRAAVRDLATAPSAESADLLVAQLASTAPSAELASFISETLELTALHQVNDSSGTTVRWRLIDRLLGLGFPHALHVTPDDLDYHRERGSPSGQLPAALTMIASALSTLWFFFNGLLAASTIRKLSGWQTVVTFVLLLCAAHCLAAFISALKASRGEHAPLLVPIGWSFFAGLGLIGAAQLADHNGAIFAGILGAPALLTAMLCGLTAASTKTPPAPALAPVPDTAAEAARAPRANVRA